MYRDRRHKYFIIALTLATIILLTEVFFPDLVWWQRWLLLYLPAGIAIQLLAQFMGWWVKEPNDDWDAMTPEQREASRYKRP